MRTSKEHQQSVALLERQLTRLKRVKIQSRREWLEGKPCGTLTRACADCGVIRTWVERGEVKVAPSAFLSEHPKSRRLFVRSTKKSRLGRVEAKEVVKMASEVAMFIEAIEAWNRKQVPV
jgi:hypothetical protein